MPRTTDTDKLAAPPLPVLGTGVPPAGGADGSRHRAGVPAGSPAGRRAALAAFVEAHVQLLLTALVVLDTALFTGLNIYRMYALRQGFDFLVYEQPIWNTVHGRPFAQSMYSFAPTHLGVDLVLFELWIVPFFALWQSPITLFLLISLGAGLGALPLFLIARDRYGSAVAGLGWAALYLAYLPVGAITLSEFQPRLFSASALLGAYWFYRRERPVAFWLCLLLAITVRSDVGLVVGCFGLYALLARRPWVYSLAPAVVGFGYWAAAVFVIVPALAGGHGFLWQVNYRWLGANSREIVATILRHPLYTAQGGFTLEKGRYLAQLLWPLGFLPLLRPRLLLIPLPILALNLLSEEPVQFDLVHQYQALIVPFLFVAGLEGLAGLWESRGTARARRLLVLGGGAILAAALLLPAWPGNADSRNGLHPGFAPLVPLTLLAIAALPVGLGLLSRRLLPVPAKATIACAALLGLIALQHLAVGSEIITFLKRPGPSPRLAAGQRLIARVPPDAPIAVTSQLGIHLPLREAIYHFPGNDSYDPALIDRAHFVLADRRRDAKERAAVERLQDGGNWRVVAEDAHFVLFERVQR